jgi:hypothetical protein
MLTTGKRTKASLKRDLVRQLFFLAAVGSPTSWVMAQPAGTFTPGGSMTTGRLSHTATLLADGRVLIAGGQIFSDSKWAATWSAELYDPSTGTFSATGHMTTTRLYQTATLLGDGKVLIAGGLDGESNPLGTAEVYDPDSGTFTATGNMTVARGAPTRFSVSGPSLPDGPTATLVAGGMVLIAGGLDGESDPLSSAELYDPDTGAFTATGDMTTASIFVSIPCGGPGCLRQLGRVLHTSTLLPNGTVLITGGWPNPGDSLASAELYEPLTGTFSATGDMVTGRCLHTATLLNDGSILITGGIENYDSFFAHPGVPQTAKVLDSAELYHPAVTPPPPALLSLSGDGRGQGAIRHADRYQPVSPSNRAAPGEALIIYSTGLADGNVIPPQVAIGGRMAEAYCLERFPDLSG